MRHAVIDITAAPENVRAEIEALGRKGIFDMAEMDKLSAETKQWIRDHASKGEQTVNAVMEVYASIIRDLNNAILGLQVLNKVVSDEDAKAMNLALYNACAEFCREYNTKEIMGDDY
jgi:hypothetical protein